jgi:non-ribosomal peptide synthetase component F
MELKALRPGVMSDSLEKGSLSALLPVFAEDLIAIWQIPCPHMLRFRPVNLASDASADHWRAPSACLAWSVPGRVVVHDFRQVLTQAVQQKPWLRAQWSPLRSTVQGLQGNNTVQVNTGDQPNCGNQFDNGDWVMMLPKQHYLDFEYVDISDMPLVDDESWWSDYGQLLLGLAETPVVHRLLKLKDDLSDGSDASGEAQYLYLCCFWPDYLAPQAMMDWLNFLAKAWQSPSFRATTAATPTSESTVTLPIRQMSQAIMFQEIVSQEVMSQVTMLEQHVLAMTVELPTLSSSSSGLQQQQQMLAPSAQQALLLLCQRYACQPIDVLALLTALLIHEYYAPQQSQPVVCYPVDQSGLITACRPFFVRFFSADFSAQSSLADMLADSRSEAIKGEVIKGTDGATKVEVTAEVNDQDSTSAHVTSAAVPSFAVSHLLVRDLDASSDFRYRPSQIQGVHLWLMETAGTWQWQLLYDTQRFMPLQWLSRLEQLLIQMQRHDTLKDLKFITDAEHRLYQRSAYLPSQNLHHDHYLQQNSQQSSQQSSQHLQQAARASNQSALEDAQVLDWLYHHARLSPDQLALVSLSVDATGQTTSLTYRQLWQRSTQWAEQLKAQGAGSEQVIALHFAVDTDLLTAILAVWLSGAAVVVLDPRWPLARKRFLIKQTAAQLIVGEPLSASDTDVLPLQNKPIELRSVPLVRPQPLDGDALACVLMTFEQGDGVAGIEFSHRQIAQQIYSSCEALGCLTQKNWRLLLNAELCSEALIRQMAMALSQGGTLVIPPQPLDHCNNWQLLEQSLANAPMMRVAATSASTIDYVEIRCSQLATLTSWLQAKSLPASVQVQQSSFFSRCRQVVLIETPLVGQSMAVAVQTAVQLSQVLPASTMIGVAFGCAESIGFLALFDYRQRLSARYAAYWPIGKILTDFDYRVVNAQGRLCPWGLAGDLYVRSHATTRAHVLSQAYVPPSRNVAWQALSTGLSDDDGGLWLRTGDRVQHDHKGQLFWLGRDDDQSYIAGMRVVPRSLAAKLCALARLDSLVLIHGPSWVATDSTTAYWVIWQPSMHADHRSSVLEWSQVLRLLKGHIPEALLPSAALLVNENAEQVAARLQRWISQAPHEQLLALQQFFLLDGQQQLLTQTFWQQRLAAVTDVSGPQALLPINPASYATLEANFLAVDDHLADLPIAHWLAALRLAWQINAKASGLLWIEVLSGQQPVTYCEQLVTNIGANLGCTERRAQEWVTIAEHDWAQGLVHQPACLPLASTVDWPLSQKLAWVFWQIDPDQADECPSVMSFDRQDDALVPVNDLVFWQKRLTLRLQRLAKSFGWVVGRLQYRQQTWLQVVHADHAPVLLRDLSAHWLRQLSYLRDFPLLPLAGLQGLSTANRTVMQTESMPQDMYCPLTLPQQELLMLLHSGESTAHISLGYWLDHSGALNLHRWQQTVQQWVNAFVALRSRLVVEDVAHPRSVRQKIVRKQEVILLSEDWSAHRQDWQAIAVATQALIDRPRSLLNGELIDYYVIQLSHDLWRLLIVAHPLVLDDRASSRLLLQMYQQYLSSNVPSLLDTYPAFLHQQQMNRQQLAQPSLANSQAEDRKQWIARGVHKKRRSQSTAQAAVHTTANMGHSAHGLQPNSVRLPNPSLDQLRPQQLPRWRFAGVLPTDQNGYRRQSLTVNEETWLPILHRAKREGVPVAFVIKVFYSMLLAQYANGQQDSLLFEYESGRSGMFVDSMGCFCRRRALWLPRSLLQSKTATIEQLLQHSKQEYDQTRCLLLEELDSPGLTAQMGFVDAQAGFMDEARDLGILLGFSESLQQPGCVSLLAHAQAQRLTLRLHYYAQEFNPLEFLPRLVSLLTQWLAGVSRLADLDFLLPEERHQQMQLWSQGNRRIAKWPPIYRLIDEQVMRTPSAVAVQCGSKTLTYQQMDNLAAQTAQRLFQLGCQPGEVVMVCTHAQVYLPSAILGVLKTAACYLPVDSSKNTWLDMRHQCRVRFLLTQSVCKADYERQCPELTVLAIDQFDANRVRSFQPRPVAAKDPLYVLCRQQDHLPLLVNYEAQANLVQWYCNELAIKPQDRLLWYASTDFYAAQKNIFAALVSGACLVMSPQHFYDPDQLLQEIEAQQISVLNISPSAFYPLLTANASQPWQALSSLRVLVLGKEAVELSRLRAWLGRPDNRCRVLITYAQDLCADVVAGHWLDLQQDQEFVPLGKPVHGVQLFVMDVLGRLKPTGLTGQVVILGQTVGRAVEEMTDANLVEVPGVGRLYYSRDLACYARPGQLRYMGKVAPVMHTAEQLPLAASDHLVHEKNTAIQQNVIENKLRGFEGVVNARLVQLEHEWVVYLQLANQQAFSTDALRNKVQWLFPEKNLPLRFVSVDQIPTEDAEGDAA